MLIPQTKSTRVSEFKNIHTGPCRVLWPLWPIIKCFTPPPLFSATRQIQHPSRTLNVRGEVLSSWKQFAIPEHDEVLPSSIAIAHILKVLLGMQIHLFYFVTMSPRRQSLHPVPVAGRAALHLPSSEVS